MGKITYLSKETYMLLVKRYEGRHWTPETINQRWEYHSRVVELIKSLNISDPSDVLEMGTMGISCVDHSDTIDYLERWDFPGKKPTYIHDSRNIPWPISDKQYELFIALRVFQHLTPFQKEATKEAMRIARKVIIVVPDIYRNKELPDSQGIKYMDFVDFLGGIHPNLYFSTQDEFVYYWDVEHPSQLNLEVVMGRTHIDNRQTLMPKIQENKKRYFILEKTEKAAKSLMGKGWNTFQKIASWRAKEVEAALTNGGGKHSPRNASRHIEFIGPAGIGKSTVCNELRKYAIGDWGYRENIPNTLIQYAGEFDEHLYLGLLYSKVKHLENYGLGGYQKLRLIGYFSDVLLKDLAIYNSNSSSKRFLLDEGLCHNFFEELIDLSNGDLETLMAKRALVFMQARNSDTIVNQIRKRERETGQLVAYYVGLNDDGLKDFIESGASLFNAFVNRVEALGVPVRRIFVEDGLQVNVKHVLDFEKCLVQSS